MDGAFKTYTSLCEHTSQAYLAFLIFGHWNKTDIRLVQFSTQKFSYTFYCQQQNAQVNLSISYYFSIFANFVYCGSHTRLTVPIGPFLCLAMMISEIPFISES